jgi:hypothetical protein
MTIRYYRGQSCPTTCYGYPIHIIERLPIQGLLDASPELPPTSYETRIRQLLDQAFTTRVGQCVWCEICLHSRFRIRITITEDQALPRRAFSYPIFRRPSPGSEKINPFHGNAVRVTELTEWHHPAAIEGGRPLGGYIYLQLGRRTPVSSSGQHAQIPVPLDTVLIHEIVHVISMGLSGWSIGTELRFHDGRVYGSVNDFFAILVENYYRSERRQALRRDHDGYLRMQEDESGSPEDWLYNTSTGRSGSVQDTVTNMDLVNVFTRMQPQLSRCLSGIEGLSFNPVRQLYT